MYYLNDGCDRYYAGQCYSDEKIPVWKGHYTRSLGFNTRKEASSYAKDYGVYYSCIQCIDEEK